MTTNDTKCPKCNDTGVISTPHGYYQGERLYNNRYCTCVVGVAKQQEAFKPLTQETPEAAND